MPDKQRFANQGAHTTLAEAVDSTETSIDVTDASVFPQNTESFFYITISDSSGNKKEICKVSGVSGNTLTVERGVDGTVAQEFSIGDPVQMRLNAGVFQSLYDEAILRSNVILAVTHGRGGQLQFSSTTEALFVPYRGNRVAVIDSNGDWGLLEIPDAGISFSGSGLVANTTYYAYVYNNGGSLAGELSIVGHELEADSQIRVRIGDNTRTLVGALRTDSTGVFRDSPSQRLVASWFNPRVRSLRDWGNVTAQPSHYFTNSVGVEWFTFGGVARLRAAGDAYFGVGGETVLVAILEDGGTLPAQNPGATLITSSSGTKYSVAALLSKQYAEGHHRADLAGQSQVGTIAVVASMSGVTY